MKHILVLLTLVATLCPAVSAEEIDARPGSIAAMATEKLAEITQLKVRGSVSGADLEALRDHARALRSLDLGEARIEPGTPLKASAGYSVPQHADVLPAGSLCGLQATEIVLPSTLTEIGEMALANAAVTSITIPASVTRIADYAFHGSGLRTFLMPATVRSIGKGVFARCLALEDMNLSLLPMDNLPAETLMGCTALRKVVLPNTASTIGARALQGTSSLESISHYTIRYLDTAALEGCGLRMLEATWLREAGAYSLAFMPNLRSIDISGNKVVLEKGALAGNTSLSETAVTAPGHSLPALAFAGTPGADFSDAVISAPEIGDYALRGNRSAGLTLGASVRSIGRGVTDGMTALRDIDATALYDDIPAATDESFGSIDRSGVKLTVAEGKKDAWKAAPGWNGFNIVELAGIDTPAADTATGGISMTLSAGILTVAAPSDITRVDIHDASGLRIKSVSPGSESAAIDMNDLPAGVYVATARTATEIRTLKLSR